MSTAILNTTFLALAFLGLFAIGEILFHRLRIKVEITRKFIHLGTGMLSLLFPILLKNHWLVLLLCSSFLVLLVLSKRFHLLPSINSIDRISYGSLWYPVSVYLCYLAFECKDFNIAFYYIPILILAISDPFAAIAGKHLPSGKIGFRVNQKTRIGSGTFFITASIISFLTLYFLWSDAGHINIILSSLIIAAVTTTVELFTGQGHDNITIPASALSCLFIFDYTHLL